MGSREGSWLSGRAAYRRARRFLQTKIETINIKITAPPAAIPAIAPTGSPPLDVDASGEALGEMVADVEMEESPPPGTLLLAVVDGFFGGAVVVMPADGFGFGLGIGVVVVVGFGSILCE